MFDYTICNMPDAVLFEKQCRALEKHIPQLTAEPILEDVDGTLIQSYRHPRGEVTVRNDMYIGALWVESEFDLKPFFN